MTTEHTIVVRFPEGAEPDYSSSTKFQSGEVVAVAFDGNRLAVEEALYEALKDVHGLICEGSKTGFNPTNGDWAERLFLSNGKTFDALAKWEGGK